MTGRIRLACFALSAALMAVMSANSSAAELNFSEIARFNVATAGIGGSPSSVAWNGSRLFIAGFNVSNGTGTAGIVEITNATSTGVVTPTFGTVFGTFASTPSQRGYTGIDLLGSTLAAAYDSGSAVANGIQTFNVNSSNQVWGISARGSSGIAFDPGFGPNLDGAGTAWTTIGSGRRILQNNLTGVDIYTSANGMIINTGTGTNWRDIDFDPANGNIYSRRSNGIFQGVRDGANSLSATNILKPTNSATDTINGQNLSFLNYGATQSALIYNDRTSVSSGQDFLTVLKAMSTSGTPLTTQFDFLGGSAPATSNGFYSFDFDFASQTLAIADFTNRNVHIFSVVPEPSTFVLGTASAVAIGFAAWRRRKRAA